MRKTFRSLMDSGHYFVGMTLMQTHDMLIEVLAQSGFDFVTLDMEHDRQSYSELMHMIYVCEAADVAVQVRVPGLDEVAVKKVLDMGATSIKFPDITTPEKAAKAASMCRYPPEGNRGCCMAVRCNGYGIDPVHSYEMRNREVVVHAIIESLEGLENMEAIIATPGIDVVSIGTGDLTGVMGLVGQRYHPRIMQEMKRCSDLCLKYGKQCSPASIKTMEDAERYRDMAAVTHFHLAQPGPALRALYTPMISSY